MRTKFIVNPLANKGRCGARWPEIRRTAEAALGAIPDTDIALTRGSNDATALAREAVAAGYRRLVAVGGDGTFNEVLNGVVVRDQPTAPDLVLAQLPGGTSNELSRSFGQLKLDDACRALAGGATREIDIFRADAQGYAGGTVTRYGFALAIVGAAATISWRAQRVPLLKRLGPIAYVIMTAVTSLSYAPKPYRIEIDGEPEQSVNVWGMLLCNFDGAGEGLLLAPGADNADGQLELIMVGDMGRWESLKEIVPKLGDGSYLQHPKVLRRRARRVTMSSETMVRADVDGESIGRLPMTVEVLPFQLRVAVNATQAD